MKTLKIIFALFFFHFGLEAQTVETVSDGDWGTSSTWDGGTVPGTSDDVWLNNNHDITIDAADNFTIAELTMWNKSSLTINGDLTIDSLHINNRADLFVNGSLTILGGVTMSPNSALNIDATGDLDVQGDFETDNNVDLYVDGSMSVDGDMTTGTGTELLGTGDVTVGGTVSGAVEGDEQINSTLPVELVSFTVYSQNGKARLKWKTAAEINNDYFTVEKSFDGNNFTEVKKVRGAAFSNIKQTYYAEDKNPGSEKVYYRLKQTDFDGTMEIIGLKFLEINSMTNNSLKVFPNPLPAGSEMNVQIPENLENYKISIANNAGQIIFEKSVDNSMERLIQIPGYNFASLGTYYIIVSNAQQKIISKILVIK